VSDILLEIANRLERRVKEFETFPRTQATDAMKGIGTDIVTIIRKVVDDSGVEVSTDGVNLNDRVDARVKIAFDELFGEEAKGGKQ